MKGHFYKRGTKWYFIVDIGRDSNGKRKQKQVGGFKTKKEAEKACAELIAQIENNLYIEPSKMSFGEFIMEFMEDHVKPTVRESTFNNQMVIVRKHIIPDIGNIELSKITPMLIQRFYNQKVKQGYNPSYIKGMHAIVSKALKTAAEWEMISKNIAELLKPPRLTNGEFQVWTIDEVNHFLSVSEKRRLYIAYILAIYTGMRKGEILGLRWKDCDLDKGRISIRQTLYKTGGKLVFQEPKTRNSRRSISLPESAVTYLKKHKVYQNKLKLTLGSAYQDYDL